MSSLKGLPCQAYMSRAEASNKTSLKIIIRRNRCIAMFRPSYFWRNCIKTKAMAPMANKYGAHEYINILATLPMTIIKAPRSRIMFSILFSCFIGWNVCCRFVVT